MRNKLNPARKRAALILILGLSSGCATVSIVPVEQQPLPPDLGPVCANSQTDPKGPAECARRLDSYVRRNIAATVVVFDQKQRGDRHRGGTGAVISHDGLILTAYHIIAGATDIAAQIRSANLERGMMVSPVEIVPMEIVAIWPERDLALLSPRRPADFPAHFQLGLGWQPRPEELLWHFGRTSVGLRGAVKVLSAEAPLLKLTGLVVMDTACRGGDSGGPVVTLDGRLVGIVLASPDKDEYPTYFLPVSAFPKISVVTMPEPADPAPADAARDVPR